MSRDADQADGAGPKFGRTTISPAPVTTPDPAEPARGIRRVRVRPMGSADLSPARAPIPGARILRLGLAGMLFLLALLTIAGAILMLLLWQQDRDAGVLTTQVDRAWELFGHLRDIERLVAFALIPVSVAWVVMATINVRRATGQRRNPIVSSACLLVGIGGVWAIGSEVVATADDWVGRGVGYVLQALCIAVPLLALERVAAAGEARRRPMHVTALLAICFIVHFQEQGGLAGTEVTADPDRWAMLGVHLVIGALLLALGALATNEAARAIEEGTDHRYELRHRFGESVLVQAGLA